MLNIATVLTGFSAWVTLGHSWGMIQRNELTSPEHVQVFPHRPVFKGQKERHVAGHLRVEWLTLYRQGGVTHKTDTHSKNNSVGQHSRQFQPQSGVQPWVQHVIVTTIATTINDIQTTPRKNDLRQTATKQKSARRMSQVAHGSTKQGSIQQE